MHFGGKFGRLRGNFFGIQEPSKATHYEWLERTRTTFRIGKHLSAKRFRSVQNYPPLIPKWVWEKSTEAKPRLKKALKNREINPPLNLLSSESSKLTAEVHRNSPLDRSSAICLTNSRNPHFNLFRTSAGIARTHKK
uniref:Uncharacterized protein n=1 Tax=Heterorhabditis bacteriophora TaxID=37862 RepID=A0A1I7X364_HETBA